MLLLPANCCCNPSIMGRNICPRGDDSASLGKSIMCRGMPWPRRNVATASEKLLQLCVKRLYAPLHGDIGSSPLPGSSGEGSGRDPKV